MRQKGQENNKRMSVWKMGVWKETKMNGQIIYECEREGRKIVKQEERERERERER